MAEQVLTSLAILKVNWDRGSDYIENFVPFVAECLRAAPHPEVSLPDLQEAVLSRFGLKIPQGALKTIIGRAVKRGYANPTHGIYRRDADALASLDLSTLTSSAGRRHEALVHRLLEFCEMRHGVRWSQQEAETALLCYLNERSLPILAAAIEGEPIPPPSTTTPGGTYVIEAFIAHLCESDPEGFEFLEDIVKGSMLANVLFFPDLGRVTAHFRGVDVYFDTQLLLRALGHAGPTMQASCRELMDLLYELNAGLTCFRHTCEEILGVLEAARQAVRDARSARGPLGETLQYFVDSSYRASDVELIVSQLERSIASLRVRLKTKPAHVARLAVDEAKLESTLRETVGYRREEALRHDMESLTAVYRLRGGEFPRHVESCGAVFITTNPRLARASADYFREEYQGAAVPLCIPDSVFTTLVWLKKPLRTPDLPRKTIIASCYAALNPPDALWRDYLGEVDRLRQHGNFSEEDYHLLRFSMEARSTLMDITLGDPDAFAEGTVEQVLEKARATVREKVEADRRAEKERRLSAEMRAAEAEARLEAERQAQLAHYRTIGARVGVLARRTTLGVLLLVQAALLWVTFPQPFPELPQQWARLAAPLAIVCSGVLTTMNLTFGTTLSSWTRRIETRVAGLVEARLKEILMP
jgi:hypothetical protein